MNEDMKLYYDYTVSPLGKLFYTTAWKQLGSIENKKILDFGSGFAYTTNFLAQKNELVALEAEQSMIDATIKKEAFTQIHGNLENLKQISANSFDVVICHLVFEFVENPQEILQELMRVLKDNGILSIIRHNRAGRIIQAIVQEYNLEEARSLLQGGYSYSSAFGDIKYYENEDILKWSNNGLEIQEIHGIRTLASMHNADIQAKDKWLEDMQELEWALQQHEEYIKISYFNHLILKKL